MRGVCEDNKQGGGVGGGGGGVGIGVGGGYADYGEGVRRTSSKPGRSASSFFASATASGL